MTQKRSFSMKGQTPGSPSSGEPEFLAIGKLRRPHGVRGEIRMSVWTDFPERLKPGVDLFVGKEHKVVTIRSVRRHQEDLLISFEGYISRDEVGLFRNQVVEIRAEDIPPLDEGEIYLHQVIGLQVINTENGELLGTITEIIETGANDVFIVRRGDGSEILLPDIAPVILDIDIEKKEMRIKPLPGLFPDE